MIEIIRKIFRYQHTQISEDGSEPKNTFERECDEKQSYSKIEPIGNGYKYSKNKILLYSPNIGGHRPLYARILCDHLIEAGYKVVIAFIGIKVGAKEVFREYDSSSMSTLKNLDNVCLLKLVHNDFDVGKHIDILDGLIHELKPEKVIIMDGELLSPSIVDALLQNPEVLPARLVPIYILSEYFYKNKRNEFEEWLDDFHTNIFPRIDRFEFGFYSDENVVESIKSDKCVHIPELVDETIDDVSSSERKCFYERQLSELKSFVERNNSKKVLLCYGDVEPRKGLDFFYRFCQEHEDFVLLRLGRLKPDYRKDWDSLLWRESILISDRLFELDCYLEDSAIVDYAFNAVNYIALPYYNHLRTSGALVVSLLRSKPVLVSSCGLMAKRVGENGVGMIFKNGNYESFRSSLLDLDSNWVQFRDNVEKYREGYLGSEYLAAQLDKILQ